jgi:hypothetical protein
VPHFFPSYPFLSFSFFSIYSYVSLLRGSFTLNVMFTDKKFNFNGSTVFSNSQIQLCRTDHHS